MTCRHQKGDPNCSSTVGGRAWQENQDYNAKQRADTHAAKMSEAKKEIAALLDRTPNPRVYEITKHEQVGKHIVLEVHYSSCKACSFDARKVMVFLGVDAADILYWRQIDPHFSEGPDPAPRARFPADAEGWTDALEYARSKS